MKRELPEHIQQKIDDWNRLVNADEKALKQNFKLELEFRTGRNGNDILAFDSVIAHYAALHVLGADFFNVSNDHDEPLGIRPPLWKVQFEDDYFYLCSYLNDIPDQVCYLTKRFEKQMLSSVKVRRVSMQMGEFKSYHMPTLFSSQRKYVIWGTGNIEMIQRVLPNPLHVGKKHDIGFGECHYRIERQNDPRTHAIKFRNFLMRSLPVAYCQKLGWEPENPIIVWRPISPPYFGIGVRNHECYEAGKLKEKNASLTI